MVPNKKVLAPIGRVAFLFLSSYVQGHTSCAENYKKALLDITTSRKNAKQEKECNITNLTGMIVIFHCYT